MSEEKGFAVWLDSRMPTLKILWNDHMAKYYAPKNFNFWYYFGVLAMVVLVIQLVTGVWLLMSYQGSAEQAFASVEYIMRDVELGWVIRYARRIHVFSCRLHAYVPRIDVWLLQATS